MNINNYMILAYPSEKVHVAFPARIHHKNNLGKITDKYLIRMQHEDDFIGKITNTHQKNT